MIASPLRYIFSRKLSRMSTVFAHHPNWAVSCTRFSVLTTSRTLRHGWPERRMFRSGDPPPERKLFCSLYPPMRCSFCLHLPQGGRATLEAMGCTPEC